MKESIKFNDKLCIIDKEKDNVTVIYREEVNGNQIDYNIKLSLSDMPFLKINEG